jgi:hypothetical protein
MDEKHMNEKSMIRSVKPTTHFLTADLRGKRLKARFGI